MKFGKHIQAHQVPGWSNYYLDYKFLKKTISALSANRPASEAASPSPGIRVAESAPIPPTPFNSGAYDAQNRPPLFSGSSQDDERDPTFKAHRATFFFKLERELEKINAFYLQKEAELKLRLEALLSKRRAAAARGMPDHSEDSIQNHAEWSAVEEGFRLLERDLGKLQQFVELNATGFRKILKKFDKRSTSSMKEMYLSSQVDVQPVFNRQLISELSDTVAACLADLTDLSSGLKFEGRGGSDIFVQQLLSESVPYKGPFRDLESNMRKALNSRDETAIRDCVHYSETLARETTAQTNVMRILWSIIIEAPPDLADLILASLSSPFDYHFIDDINGRTCLHEAAIAGAIRLVDICIKAGVPTDKVDVYGRSALHYAAINGHPAICQRLLQEKLPENMLDLDNYSPLIYAITHGSVECVRALIASGQPLLQPTALTGDLAPLSLAAQYGHVELVLLLLEYKCPCLPNSNGEYPMHLAARNGHPEVCRLLLHKDGWDIPDKYHEWTPLFHAARYGHDSCVQILLAAGSRCYVIDEHGLLPVHYAAWNGHRQCISYLLAAQSSIPTELKFMEKENSPASIDSSLSQMDMDAIPSLRLPPPIMPPRIYGHNYLDGTHLVQITVGKAAGSSGVKLLHRKISPIFRDEYLIASAPLKLVITSATSASFPLALSEKSAVGTFVFQIQSMEELLLEFSICPSFGTKTIGRAVALPSLFTSISNSHTFILPILDNRLHVVGEIAFEVNIITAFRGVALEVGGGVETYWKSTVLSSNPLPPLASWPQRISSIGSVHTSPSAHSISGSVPQASTISSLRGTFVHLTVQCTRDLCPVVFAPWLLPETGFNLGVADVTLAEFENVASRLGQDNLTPSHDITESSKALCRSMILLSRLLEILPVEIGVNIEVAYPSKSVMSKFHLGRRQDLNEFLDAILRAIYAQPTLSDPSSIRRSIVFSSFDPDVCSGLNWKQPNYPVFFSSHCGNAVGPLETQTEVVDDPRLTSIGAAVDFAKSNNLLGILVDGDLLLQVPSLINSVRSSGLLVGIQNGSDAAFTQLTSPSGIEGTSVDAFRVDGTLVFTDHPLAEG